MNCDEFKEYLVDFTREELSPRDRQRMQDHASTCRPCARALEEETALASHLEDLGGFLSDVQPSGRLRESLLESFRKRQPGSTRVGSGLSSLTWLAAAALILMAFGGVLYQFSNPARSLQPTPVDRAGAIPDAHVYSDFIPLGNCVSLDCLDRAQLMRIDLPRSSVQYFGIPSNRFEFEGERIKADVLVGEDGIARAIRFVY